MKKLIALIMLCIVLLALAGCGPQPLPHRIYGREIMFVPEGTRIGSLKAPKDGLFIVMDRVIQVDEAPQKVLK